MVETSRYGLPLLQAGRAQKEITHNEALARVDALLHLVIESRRSNMPPSAADGRAWLVAPAATGAWAGRDGAIAVDDASGWSFIVPREGCIAFVRDEEVFICFVAGAWRDRWPVAGLSVAGRPCLGPAPGLVTAASGGAVIDAEVRATVSQLLATLRAQGLIADE